jgi:PAS domain-containing protein
MIWMIDTAFRRSQNPMALKDGDGRLVRVNPAMSQLLG